MNHAEQLIEGDDATALTAFFENIATDDEPFIIAMATALPSPGLVPDKENGRRIFEMSCTICHDVGLEGMPSLHGAKDWLNPVQVMAKARKFGDWFNDNKNATYAVHRPSAILAALGVIVACAEEEGDEATEAHMNHEHEAEEGLFPADAMPFYGTDILTDQQVVDVAFYVAEDL
jgi:mono/diheme cytochrome c family protein